MKKILLAAALVAGMMPVNAQLLKKLKDKVNKTVNGDSGSERSSSDNSSGSSNGRSGPKDDWCLTVKGDGAAGEDGVAYSLAYSSPGRINIEYTESLLGLATNPSGYRLILSEYANSKRQFLVVENGQVVSTGNTVKPEYLKGGISGSSSSSYDRDAQRQAMEKYIVADTSKINIPKTKAQSHTVKKIDENQIEQALIIAKQTDEYKALSAEEKKDFEAMIRQGMEQNNAMAGQTFNIPEQKGGSIAAINGYFLIVKGKKYGKFVAPPTVEVTQDETSVFAIGLDEKAAPVMIANGKKTALDKNKFSGSGYILKSPDQKKFVYLEQKQMSEKELDEMSSGNFQMNYTVLKSDGTSFVARDYNSSGKFTLTNSGNILHINESTGEVYSDNKKIGQFKMADGDRIDGDALLIGSDPSKIAYYGNNGTLHYLDGTSKNMGILFPRVVSANGKSYLSWFRKCNNDIYIGRYEF